MLGLSSRYNLRILKFDWAMSTMHILSAGIGMCPLDEGFESLNNEAQECIQLSAS